MTHTKKNNIFSKLRCSPHWTIEKIQIEKTNDFLRKLCFNRLRGEALCPNTEHKMIVWNFAAAVVAVVVAVDVVVLVDKTKHIDRNHMRRDANELEIETKTTKKSKEKTNSKHIFTMSESVSVAFVGGLSPVLLYTEHWLLCGVCVVSVALLLDYIKKNQRAHQRRESEWKRECYVCTARAISTL